MSIASFKDTEEGKLLEKLIAVPFSVIPARETAPLWPGWVLRRHVTLLVAPGGTGKGLLTIDMAARVTRGKPFPGEPDSAVREPAPVILVTPEDDANETVAWRLKAAGADLSMVYNLTVLPDGTPFSLPGSVDDLREAIKEIEHLAGRPVGLVVIDPLFACVKKPLTTNPAARAVVDPLELLARETDTAVVLTHHTVKSGAVAGAKGLTDAVRCVLRISRPDKEGHGAARVLSVEKANNTGESVSIRYVINGEGVSTCITWPVEVEQLQAVLSSRGYEIQPDLATAAAPAEPGDLPQAELVELFETDGKQGIESLGRFESADKAKSTAEQVSRHSLAWKAGPIDGSHGAATQTPGGKFRYYSIIPVTA
jgi:KaiC/GvpD/RAD55 family RecA-like ATPase